MPIDILMPINILRDVGEQPKVVLHTGTNDIGRKRDEVVQSENKELGRKFKCGILRVDISGLFPVLHASNGRNPRDRIGQMNIRLRTDAGDRNICFGTFGISSGQFCRGLHLPYCLGLPCGHQCPPLKFPQY